MAFAKTIAQGDGSTTDFNFGFSYISSSDVKVYVGGVLQTVTTDYTFVTSTQIRLNTAPGVGVLVIILRNSVSGGRKVDYVPGGLTESVLDTDSLQAFYAAQEATDAVNDAMTTSAVTGQWDGQSLQIEDVADPTSDQDVATKSYVDTGDAAALAAKDAAETSAAEALASKNAAEVAQAAAESSESTAETHATNAALYATGFVDILVEGVDYNSGDTTLNLSQPGVNDKNLVHLLFKGQDNFQDNWSISNSQITLNDPIPTGIDRIKIAYSIRASAGALAAKSTINNSDWSGADLGTEHGGTGASTPAAARTSLGLQIGSDVQAHSSVLDETTASYTTTDETKLSSIEASADVTDTTNVKAAINGQDIEIVSINGQNTATNNRQVFTSSGSFTKSTLPDHVTHVIVHVWGAGGSGGASSTASNSGGGGGGGGFSEKRLAVSALATSEVVTIGAGGSGVANGAANTGNSGGGSSFGSHCTANGGSGGSAGLHGGGGARGGTAGTGDITMTGGIGHNGTTSVTQERGHGGAGALGSSGGRSGFGENGDAPGGGGAGGFATTTGTTGNGGNGLVVVRW